MRSTLESTLPWWVAGPLLGLVITSLLGLANKRFGVLGGVTDLVEGSTEGRGLHSWHALLVVGIVLGGLAYTLLAGAPDAGGAYSWLDAHLTLGDSPRLYLLMGATVAVAFVGARLLRGRRALLTGEPIGWTTARPTRNHIVSSVMFGIGWGISEACPGPAAAQLGAGRVLALAVAGVLVGVRLQPRLARAVEQATAETPIPAVQGADVL